MGPVGRIEVHNMPSIGCPRTLAVEILKYIGPCCGQHYSESPFTFRTLSYCEAVSQRSCLNYSAQFKVLK